MSRLPEPSLHLVAAELSAEVLGCLLRGESETRFTLRKLFSSGSYAGVQCYAAYDEHTRVKSGTAEKYHIPVPHEELRPGVREFRIHSRKICDRKMNALLSNEDPSRVSTAEGSDSMERRAFLKNAGRE